MKKFSITTLVIGIVIVAIGFPSLVGETSGFEKIKKKYEEVRPKVEYSMKKAFRQTVIDKIIQEEDKYYAEKYGEESFTIRHPKATAEKYMRDKRPTARTVILPRYPNIIDDNTVEVIAAYAPNKDSELSKCEAYKLKLVRDRSGIFHVVSSTPTKLAN